MTEFEIPFPPITNDEHLDSWLQLITQYLRDNLDDAYLTAAFVDRGDPSALDFDIDDLTCDGTWNDLDLSSIVPSGTVAVCLRVGVRDTDAAGSDIDFRKNGNSNAINKSSCSSPVANVAVSFDIIIPVDTSRVIEYNASANYSSGAGDAINIVVKGYWK